MIGKRIRALREEQKIIQEELASWMSISRMTLNNYENEIRAPDINFAIDAVKLLPVMVECLSGRVGHQGRRDR